MSEQTKIEPCAWCGTIPATADTDYCVTHYCQHEASDMSVFADDSAWNFKQRAILAQRRKDFEAGWKEGHADDDTGKFNSESFEDYIASK